MHGVRMAHAHPAAYLLTPHAPEYSGARAARTAAWFGPKSVSPDRSVQVQSVKAPGATQKAPPFFSLAGVRRAVRDAGEAYAQDQKSKRQYHQIQKAYRAGAREAQNEIDRGVTDIAHAEQILREHGISPYDASVKVGAHTMSVATARKLSPTQKSREHITSQTPQAFLNPMDIMTIRDLRTPYI